MSCWAEVSPLIQRLDAFTRLRVLAGLAIILIAGTFLLLFIRASGRVARWYVNRQPRPVVAPGDPFPQVIDSKPRLWNREQQNWQRDHE